MSKRKQPFLHDAMKTILEECPNNTATPPKIFELNINEDLYIRPKDGNYPEDWQILLRAKKYRSLFRVLENDDIQLL